MRTVCIFVTFVAATSTTQLLARRVESKYNNYNKYNAFELTENAFLADNGELPMHLPILGTVYTKNNQDEFENIILNSVKAFTPFIKDFTYKVSKGFDVPYYTAAASNSTIILPKRKNAKSRTVTFGYNFEEDTQTVINNEKRSIGLKAQVDSHSVFESFCYPPEVAFTNITVSDDVKGVYFTSDLSSPCKQSYKMWDQSYIKVESINKYTDCQYVVGVKMETTDIDMKLIGKLSGLSTGTVKLEIVIKNQIPSKLRLSVTNGECADKNTKNNPLFLSNIYQQPDTYICLENGYWKETKFYIKDCNVYDTNASSKQQKQICNAFEKILSTVNIKSLQSLYNYQLPQTLPKCYKSSKIKGMSKKH